MAHVTLLPLNEEVETKIERKMSQDSRFYLNFFCSCHWLHEPNIEVSSILLVECLYRFKTLGVEVQ